MFYNIIFGLTDSNSAKKASRSSGDISRGEELFRILRSEKRMAILRVDRAEADRMPERLRASVILLIGYQVQP